MKSTKFVLQKIPKYIVLTIIQVMFTLKRYLREQSKDS